LVIPALPSHAIKTLILILINLAATYRTVTSSHTIL
jgi:hypothetical protein